MFLQFTEIIGDIGGNFQVISMMKIKKRFIDKSGSVIRNRHYENSIWIGLFSILAMFLKLINEFLIEIDIYPVA